ncbi:MAG TPA: MarR family transcriptional regulator [Methyloceanibacter sp.]|jgi:DNA-binding MarR family transcriptional regulator|nr:MarR family transcriptional regulator [Methyloceanibacter sp.]
MAKAATSRAREAKGGEFYYPLEHSVGYLVRVTHRSFAQDLQAYLTPHEIPIGMWYFLRALWQEDGLTQRELSQRVGAMEPTTVEQLKNMERRGFVERRRSAADRRKIHIFMTEEGRALSSRLLPYAMEVNAVALDGLTEGEIGFLRLVLARIKHNLDARQGQRGLPD